MNSLFEKSKKEKMLSEMKDLLTYEKSKLVKAAIKNDIRMIEAEIRILNGLDYEKAYDL